MSEGDVEDATKVESPSAKEGEHIPAGNKKTENKKDPTGTNIFADIAANFNEYTERPDLFLETVEKHDPGFIKRMNDSMTEHSKKLKESRYKFGAIQAYTSLAVSVIAALSCLGAIFYMILKGNAGFLPFVGLAVFYAISQGGPSGFLKVIEGCKSLFERSGSSGPPE